MGENMTTIGTHEDLCTECNKPVPDDKQVIQDGKIYCYDCKGVTPDWEGHCELCGASPILPSTGLCGPCTFGEAETAGGNW